MKYLKAIYAAFIAGVAATSTAYVSGNGHIGFVAGLTIASSIVTAAAVVWGVPNSPQPGK